jgi:high-affinity nickel-transport protein
MADIIGSVLGSTISPPFAHGMEMGAFLLVLMASGMGIRHGLDPDHLTAIDAILRFQQARKNRIVRWAGLFFSLGHGIVVMILGWYIINLDLHMKIPPAFSLFGSLFSGLFLLGMAGANGLFLIRSKSTVPFSPVGLRSRLILRSIPLDRPLFILLLGMLFAVSFDTFSQTLVFSLASASLGGEGEGLAVGLAFVIGMSLADGANGLWIARLLKRSDRRGVLFSRTLGWSVVLLTLMVGILVLVEAFVKDPFENSPMSEALLGISCVVLLSLVYLFTSLRLRKSSASEISPGT